jgi:hypothetical protein
MRPRISVTSFMVEITRTGRPVSSRINSDSLQRMAMLPSGRMILYSLGGGALPPAISASHCFTFSQSSGWMNVWMSDRRVVLSDPGAMPRMR